MRSGGGRAKGNWFEREVAKLICEAFKGWGITTSDAYRTPLSGGHLHARKSDPGDLVISKRLRKYFPFNVECKAYRRVKLWPLFFSVETQKNAWKFKAWLGQVSKGSNSNKSRHPMLIFKENNGPVIAMVPQIMPLVTRIQRRFRTMYNGEPWYAMLLSDVLKELVREAKDATE